MSYEAVRAWLALLQIAQILITAGVAVYAWRVSRDRARRAELQALDVEIGAVRERLQGLETSLQHLPTHQDLGQLYERVNSVSQDLRQITGQLGALGRQLETINEYLLNRGGDR